jgi:hypothetical protein
MGNSCYGTGRQYRELHGADRWWLVEASNAEAGRILIADSLSAEPLYVGGSGCDGRILESGGRET